MTTHSSSSQVSSSISRRALFLAATAAALALLAYANALGGKFTFDDQAELLTNTSIEDLSRPLAVLTHNVTRPVVNLSYAVDFAAWGGRDEFGFHLTNVLLHVLNVVLLFGLVRRFVRDFTPDSDDAARDATAFLAAALFAVHPMLTEAVSYISSRSELLVTMLFISSVYSFRRGFSGGTAWTLAGIGAFVLSLASKETGAMLPFVLLASDVLTPNSEWRRRLWRLHAPLIALVVCGGLLRSWLYVAVENRGTEGFATSNLLLVAHTLVRYAEMLLMPRAHTVVYSIPPIVSWFDPRVVSGAVILAGNAALAVALRRTAPLVTFGLVWFILALVPSSALILLAQVGLPMAEHRLYLPSCGFFMAIASGIVWWVGNRAPRLRARKAIATLGGVLVVCVFVALTVSRNRVWGDPVRLWQEAVQASPTSIEANLNLGGAYRTAGDLANAERAFTRSIALAPDKPGAYLALSGMFIERGRLDEAASILRLAELRIPRDAKVRLALASLQERGFRRRDVALELCREALALEPGSVDASECVRRNSAR